MTDDFKKRPIITLQPGRQKRAVGGHPWIYSNEVAMDAATKALPPGTLVTVKTAEDKNLGVATFNPHPLVSGRILDREPARRIDQKFLEGRLARALALRERLVGAPYYRLIHAEADGLPGLIVDRFGAVVVCQVNTAGMQLHEAEIIGALEAVLAPEAIVLRNDSAARTGEGLALETRVARGTIDGPIEIVENGTRFRVDVIEGQKTGWFFDQRDNRRFVAGLCAGQRVLDLYSFAGGFALQAAAAGAREVVAIDRSEGALALAGASAELNGLADRVTFRRAEAFAEMERLAGDSERFDVVIADPPAFIKSKKDVGPGLRGYRKMTRLAAALVAPSGFLFAASCSHNAEPADFLDAVVRGVADAGRSGRLLRTSGAAPDHPVHPALPESAYLKAHVLNLD